MENNAFETLPPAPFVRGFVRTLSLAVGIEPEPLLALLRRDFTEKDSGSLLPMSTWRRPRRRLFRGVTSWLLLFISAIVTVSLGYLGIHYYLANLPPFLEISAPEAFSNHEKQVLVTGRTGLDSVVEINQIPTALKPDGSFSATIEIPSQGLITLQIKATNARGKQTIEEIPVRILSSGE